MRYDLFLCHASIDKPRVAPLHAELVRAGLEVFYDDASLRAGDDTHLRIPTAQRDSRATVVCVSRSTPAAWYQNSEIETAIAILRARPGEHCVIPVYLDGIADSLTDIVDSLRTLVPIDAVKVGHPDGVARQLAHIAHGLRALPERSPLDLRVGAWIDLAVRKQQWIRVLGFHERYRTRLPLDDIFVPLRVRAGRRLREHHRTDKLAEDFVESQVVELPGALALSTETPGALGLAVLGEPGAGKTTLLKQLYSRVAREGSHAVGLPGGLLPVALRCSQLEPGDFVPNGLARAVEKEATRNGHPGAGDALCHSRRPLLFLLDGLDEVRDETSRARLCEWLGDEVDHWPGSRFVVTCRFAAWRREAVLDNRFLPVDVQRLEDDAVAAYVQKWFRAVERQLSGGVGLAQADGRAAEHAQALLGRILAPGHQGNIRLRELTENPLLLSTICLVHHSDTRLPEKRGQLYDRCISLLLETWATERYGRPHLPNEPARHVLQPLAWAMHQDEAREWPAERVMAAIEEPLSELPDLRLSATEFAERARDDCGVLASKDLGSYEFFHLSFQEYLAAAHAQDKGLAAELARSAGDPWWKEPILLSVARPGTMLGSLVRELGAQRTFAQHVGLVREAVSEAISVEAGPFLALIDGALRQKDGGSETVAAVLSCFGGRVPAKVVERARGLVERRTRGR